MKKNYTPAVSEDDSGLGLKVHEDAYRELERERDEALSDLEFRRDLFQLQEQQLNDVRAERDGLAEVLNDLWHNYSLTGAAYELIEQTLAAVEGGSDE